MKPLFISGWGGDSSLFPQLSAQCDFICPFDSMDAPAVLSHIRSTRPDVIAGWSTGAHIVMKALAEGYAPRRVVLVSPFFSFCRYTDPRIVRQMIKGLGRGYRPVLDAFYALCGAPAGAMREWDADMLKAGLEFLQESVSDTAIVTSAVTVLHGIRDAVVPVSAGEEVASAFGVQMVRLECGHYPPEEILLDYIIHEK